MENLVGYARRNALVPATRSFATFEDLNCHLRRWCERERTRHGAAWLLETSALTDPPPHPFLACTHRPVGVSKMSLVYIDQVRYSVPTAYVRRTLRAEVYVDRIKLFDGAVCVAAHTRSYVRGDAVLELAHYLPAFERKPRAAAGCAALAQADPIFVRARDRLLGCPGGHKTFAEILLLGRVFDMATLAGALEAALHKDILKADVIRQLCLNASHAKPEPAIVPAELDVGLATPDLSRYDALVGVAK